MRKGRIASKSGSEENVSDSHQCTCSSGNNDYFCKQCRRVICTFCTSTIHKHHECEPVGKVSRDIQNGIREYGPGQKKKEKMESVQRVQQMINSIKIDLIALETKKIGEIDEKLNDLHNELKKIRSVLVRKIQESVRKDTEYLNEAERILSNTAKSITSMCDAAKKLVDEQNSLSVINDGYSICADIEEVMKIKVEMPERRDAFSLEFYPGTTDDVGLQAMFGKISMKSRKKKPDGSDIKKLAKGTEVLHKESSDETTASQLPTTSVPGACSSGGAASRVNMAGITKLSSLRVNFDVWCVTCVTDDMCWYGELYSTDISLVDMTGRVVRSRKLPGACTGMTSRDGTVYISCNNKTVYKLSTDDTLTVVQKCLTFAPRGLTCLPVTGELLVCGGKDGVFSVTGRGVQPTLTGIKFGYACDIAVNDDGDVCVSDEGQTKVFIFNSDRRHVTTYTGHTDMTGTMDPQGVTCDGRGGFIVCDCNNHMLHVISRDGNNVRMYNTGTDGDRRPCTLDMTQSGRLWVGFDDGHICVYKTT